MTTSNMAILRRGNKQASKFCASRRRLQRPLLEHEPGQKVERAAEAEDGGVGAEALEVARGVGRGEEVGAVDLREVAEAVHDGKHDGADFGLVCGLIVLEGRTMRRGEWGGREEVGLLLLDRTLCWHSSRQADWRPTC